MLADIVRVVSLVLTLLLCTDGGRSRHNRLNEFIHHHETLSYHTRPVHEAHLRHKRAVPEHRDHVELSFVAHDRPFTLQLSQDHSIFHRDYHAEGPGGVTLNHLDHTHYHGVVKDEPGSHVYGSLRDGVFDGTVHTRRDGTFYVERSHRYLPYTRNSSVHSVIYHDSHVSLPNDGATGCGADTSVREWLDKVQNSAIPEYDSVAKKATESTADKLKKPPTSNNIHAAPLVQSNLENGKQPVKPDVDPAEDPDAGYRWTEYANNRVKRRAMKPPTNKKSCSLFIQTDPLLWRHIWEQEQRRLPGKPNHEIDAKTEEEILSLIAQHVKAVNKIYGDTDFDAGTYSHTGHTFEVQRIKIYNMSDCTGTPSNETNHFCLSNIDVSNFLNLHSKENHEHFCLAYVFTYRDFTGGTLGLAWVASASGASGGICEKYKTYAENINGINHKAKRSLNTGIITFVNYNSRVPPKVSQLTLAHEIGHNFGSPHDYPEACRPGGTKGNFIMFASATSGDRDNNNKFSRCSVHNISAVLDAVVEDRKTNCFEESDGAFCGNKIVEKGEECDCGFNEDECTEQCCHPRMNKTLTDAENRQLRCKRKEYAQCSPSEGKCCTNSCTFVPARDRVLCQDTAECTEASYCKGDQATCPDPTNKIDNDTECNEGTQVCQAGECKGSICLKYGMDQCFLSSRNEKSTRTLCELACMTRGSNNTCKSTTDWAKTGEIAGLTTGMTLRPGSPCDNFQGYCDVFYKCRQVDAEGPLVRLKNLLFNTKTLTRLKYWVTNYWYAVLLIGMAFVIFMALFIKCFAAHTPSSNPKMPKNKDITKTLRRPMSTLRRKARQPQASSQQPSSRSAGQPPQRSSGGGGGGGHPPPAGRGAPPAYSIPQGGPGHGYGEGRGHYNRNRGGGAGPSVAGPSNGGAGRSRNASSGNSSRTNRDRIEMYPLQK